MSDGRMKGLSDCHPLLGGCRDVLAQCVAIVEALPPGDYQRIHEDHSSVGAHVRHGMEHFTQLLAGLSTGTVDYDLRVRDMDLESNPESFLTARARLEESLAKLTEAELSRTVLVLQAHAKASAPIPVRSTVEREVLFCASHFMHHLAMIRLIAELLGTRVSPEIGVAYSTANHRANAEGSGASSCAR